MTMENTIDIGISTRAFCSVNQSQCAVLALKKNWKLYEISLAKSRDDNSPCSGMRITLTCHVNDQQSDVKKKCCFHCRQNGTNSLNGLSKGKKTEGAVWKFRTALTDLCPFQKRKRNGKKREHGPERLMFAGPPTRLQSDIVQTKSNGLGENVRIIPRGCFALNRKFTRPDRLPRSHQFKRVEGRNIYLRGMNTQKRCDQTRSNDTNTKKQKEISWGEGPGIDDFLGNQRAKEVEISTNGVGIVADSFIYGVAMTSDDLVQARLSNVNGSAECLFKFLNSRDRRNKEKGEMKVRRFEGKNWCVETMYCTPAFLAYEESASVEFNKMTLTSSTSSFSMESSKSQAASLVVQDKEKEQSKVSALIDGADLDESTEETLEEL